MSLTTRAVDALQPRHKRSWTFALAVATAYFLTRALEGGGQSSRPAGQHTAWAVWKGVVVRVYEQIVDDRLLALAAGVVFYGLLALFPAITALVSCYALFADPSTISEHLAMLKTIMPQGAYGIVDGQITRIASSTAGNLSIAFFASLAIAIWSANAGIKAIIDALNIVYGVKERRSFIRLNLVALGFTVGAIVGLLMAIAAIVALPIVLSYLPFGSLGADAVAWLRWPALLVLLMIGIALLYRFGPNRDDPRWDWFSPGTVVAAVAWLAGSALLSWYLSDFANYNATYGSLGAAIGLMMWLWMSAIVVLVGAEINSEVDASRELVDHKSGRSFGRS